MGAHPVYRYPEVPKTSSQTAISTEQPQENQERKDTKPRDSRFSWLPTPSEAKVVAGWSRSQSNSEMPPLPQVPEHLTNIVSGNPTRRPVDPNGPTQEPHPSTPQHHEAYNTPAPAYEYPTAQYSHLPQNQEHYNYPAPTLSIPQPVYTQPPSQVQTYPEDHKQDPNMDQTSAHPHPSHSTSSPSSYSMPARPVTIGPDANPLYPSSPTSQEPPNFFGRSTTMPVIPPSQPVDMPVSNFAPHHQPVRGGGWTHSLGSCSEVSICIPSLFCPCVTYGKTQYRLSQRSDKKDPTNMLGYSACNASCVAFGVLCGVNGILAAIQKTRIRKAYEMDRSQSGGVVDDCVRGVFCCCCSVAQDEKEVVYREEQARKGVVGSIQGRKEGYMSPGGMTFDAPPHSAR